MKLRKALHFTSIRTQLIRTTVSVACIAFAVCYFLTYTYFTQILRRNTIRDNQNLMQQHIQQLESLHNNVRSTAENLAVSDGVQRVLRNHNLSVQEGAKPSTSHIILLHNTIRDIRRLTSFQLYQQRGALVGLDGEGIFWGDLAGSSSFYRQAVTDEDYLAFTRADTSKIYTGIGEDGLIRYMLRIRDITLPEKAQGTLILWLSFGVLSEPMTTTAESFDGYLAVNGSHILYSKELSPQQVANLASAHKAPPGSLETYETPEGFILSCSVPGSGWQIYAFTDNVHLMRSGLEILPVMLGVLLVMVALCVILLSPTIRGIIRPLEKLTGAMKEISSGNLETSIHIKSTNEVGILADTFGQMLQDLNQHVQQSIAHEQAQQSLRLELLLSQMNPHFIYNTLNSIVYMARKEHDQDIERMTLAFIKMLQDILPRDETSGLFTTVEKDVEILQAYLTVQHYRYADLFEEHFDVQEAALSWPIPKFILQPLVENALYHGIFPRGKGGCIHITAEVSQDMLRLSVQDNGVGMTADKAALLLHGNMIPLRGDGARSIGIPNIIARLKGIYGDDNRLEIRSSSEEGTTFALRLPRFTPSPDAKTK